MTEPRLSMTQALVESPVTSPPPARPRGRHVSIPIVEVAHLYKAYGRTVAVQDVSFSVLHGEIFGIIGPNGAGKTTTVECVSGLRDPDGGTIKVLGLDPQVHRAELRKSVGVQLQEGTMPSKLKVGEVLKLFASFYAQPADADELMDMLGLISKRNEYYKRLSGGLKQRLSIALALIGNPRIAVLDELTTGLDPQARRDTWSLIETVRDRGVTVLLVTHFMDEAQRLCDRVMMIDAGTVVALGTPAAIAEQEGGGSHIRFLPSSSFDDRILTDLPQVSSVDHQGKHLLVTGTGDLLSGVIHVLDGVGVEARDVQVESASLEDAYLRISERVHRAAKEVDRR